MTKSLFRSWFRDRYMVVNDFVPLRLVDPASRPGVKDLHIVQRLGVMSSKYDQFILLIVQSHCVSNTGSRLGLLYVLLPEPKEVYFLLFVNNFRNCVVKLKIIHRILLIHFWLLGKSGRALGYRRRSYFVCKAHIRTSKRRGPIVQRIVSQL